MQNAQMAASLPETRSRRRPLRVLIFVALACMLVSFTLWAVAALYFDMRVSWLRTPLAVAFATAMLAVWFFVKQRWLAVGLTIGGSALVLAWWLSLRPSNDRDWQP